MKKLLLSLLCAGSILALPGCWCCRKTCEAPCEDYYDDYSDYDDYCDEESCSHDKEVIGHKYEGGYKMNIYKQDRQVAAPVSKPKVTYHEPVDKELIAHVEKRGKKVEYLDKQYADQNAQLQRAAQAREEAAAKPARQTRKEAVKKEVMKEVPSAVK